MIPRDVVICDWHYERADPTPVYFAMKGLDVVSCSWRTPDVAAAQVRDMVRFRESSTPQMRAHLRGVVQTIWSGAGGFLNQFQNRTHDTVGAADRPGSDRTESACFVRMFETVAGLK